MYVWSTSINQCHIDNMRNKPDEQSSTNQRKEAHTDALYKKHFFYSSTVLKLLKHKSILRKRGFKVENDAHKVFYPEIRKCLQEVYHI